MSDTQGVAHSNASGPRLALRPSTGRTGLRDPWLALALLVVLAAISGLAYYLGFTRPFPLADHYPVALLDIGKITKGTPTAANWWGIAWIVLFASYYLAFRICPPAIRVSASFRRTALGIICGAAALFSILLIFMYPITAADLFDQIFRGRITTHYALNPFMISPATFGEDAFLPYVAWKFEGSPYGPVWELLAAIPSKLAGDSLWNNLIFFKILSVLAYGASTALTYLILRTLKPEWALRGTLFFAWNPLVLFEVAGNGHNDSVMITFVLLAIYLFVRGRRIWVLPALMAGVLTKFIPVLLVPIAVAALWRDRLRLDGTGFWSRLRGRSKSATVPATTRDVDDHMVDGSMPSRSPLSNREALSTLAIGSVLALGLAVILYLPFWQGPQTIGALGRQSLFTASMPTLSFLLLESNLHISTEAAKEIARNASLVLTAITVIGLTLFVFLKGNARTAPERRTLVFRTLGAFYEMIFIYLAFANLWFQPWYLIWLVALTPFVALYTNANRTVLFCIGGIINYFVWDFLWFWSGAGPIDITVTAILAVYFLPLFYTVYSVLKPMYDRIWSREPEVVAVLEVRDQQEARGASLSTRPVRPKP